MLKIQSSSLLNIFPSLLMATPSVAAHLRGMRPTLTARKATQCLEESQTLTELSIKLYYVF